MIIDTLENAKLYAQVHPLFQKAFEFLTSQPVATLAPGRYEIDGDKLYANVSDAQNNPPAACVLEAHKKYIDIQLVVSGNEKMGWSPLACLGHEKEKNEAQDYALYKDAPLSWVDVRPGSFAIFFPGDAHAPNCGTGIHRKVVVKVLI